MDDGYAEVAAAGFSAVVPASGVEEQAAHNSSAAAPSETGRFTTDAP